MRYYVTRSLIFAIFLSFVIPALSAEAAPNRLTQCQREKLKALQSTVKKVYTCTGGELKKNGLTISTFDANCVSDVQDRFTSKWDKAIEKAAKKEVSCFNAPGPVTAANGAVSSATDVSAILRPGFAPGDNADPNAVKILNTLMKTSETYLRKTLNLQATNVAKPDPAKLANLIDKAAASLAKKFDSQVRSGAKKGIVFTADSASVLATIDAFVGTLATAIRTNSIFPLSQFQDSATQGVTYSPALDAAGGNVSIRGGWFPVTAASMTFSVGATVLGTGTVGDMVTPVTIVPGATDELNAVVTNIARLLQTLDDDSNARNGITISPSVQQAADGISLNVSQSIIAFQNDTNVRNAIAQLTNLTRRGQRSLISIADAQSHLNTTLLARHAGTYAGTFTGTDFGTWTVKISTRGILSGTAISAEDGRLRARGAISSDGSAVFGNTSSGASFMGTLTDVGVLSGTWVNPTFGDSGTFTGTRQ